MGHQTSQSAKASLPAKHLNSSTRISGLAYCLRDRDYLTPYMFRLALPIILAACLVFPACKAQSPDQPAAAGNKSLLWKISGKGMKPAYLFGTMHLICKSDYVWTDAMKQALAASEEVCFEMDMDDPKVLQEATAGIMGMGKDEGEDAVGKDGKIKPLRDYYTPAEYARISRFVKDTLGMDIAMLEQLGPGVAQMMISLKTVSCPFPESYEMNIMSTAKGAGKNIIGLETPDEQVNVLKSISSDSSAGSLVQLADSFGAAKAAYQRLLEAYKSQDLPGLHAEMLRDKDLAAQTSVFLDDRNKRWISRMGKMMEGHKVFFAVGAGHLWGNNGVINLLRKAGYEVTAVR